MPGCETLVSGGRRRGLVGTRLCAVVKWRQNSIILPVTMLRRAATGLRFRWSCDACRFPAFSTAAEGSASSLNAAGGSTAGDAARAPITSLEDLQKQHKPLYKPVSSLRVGLRVWSARS